MIDKGTLYGLAAALCFALMNVLVKVGATDFPGAEFVFARGLVGVVLLMPFIQKDLPSLFSKKSYMLWVRLLTGSLAVLALFYNIQLIGTGVAVALSNLSALFVVLFGSVLLRESLSRREWLGTTTILSGTIFLNSPLGLDISLTGSLIGLAGAFCGGVAMISLKKSAAQFSPMFIVWGFCLFNSLTALMLPSAQWSCNSLTSLSLLIVTGLFGVFGQILLTKSYALLASSIASVISLSSLLWSVLFESIYFQTLPSPTSLVSYGAIFFGLNLLQLRKKQVSSPIQKSLE